MTDYPLTPERLVKSAERVRDLGEVFTPFKTVNEILDLLPSKMWVVHPSPTFLEPACGDGNFLIAILERKLSFVANRHKLSTLPAGHSNEAATFHALESLAAIYAVDISTDNIIGGVVGHEIGARKRLLDSFVAWHAQTLNRRLTDRSPAMRAATWIVEHNLIIGNMLPLDVAGKSTGRDAIPLIEYSFQPSTLSVTLRKTTLGNVIDAAQAENAVIPKLFGPSEPELLWEGKALRLAEAEKVEAPKLKGPARNGAGARR